MNEDESANFWTKVGSVSESIRHSNHIAGATPEAPPEEGSQPEVAVAAKRAWAASDGAFWATPSSYGRLPAGMYRMSVRQGVGEVFQAQRNDTDALIELPDSASDQVIQEIRTFKTLRSKFQEHGFLYKRGILLWGPPGSGKTCMLQLISRMLIEEHDSVMVLVDQPMIAGMCLQTLRRIEPDRQVIAVMEDLDTLCQNHGESQYLALLDGESQIDNVVWIASTNYPERLDRRFVDRPSRFDTVRYIGMPSPAARETYLRAKVPHVTDDEIASYVGLSKGYSIAHLREFVILTRCFGMSHESAAKRLNESRTEKRSSEHDPKAGVFGFAPQEEV